MTPYDSIERQKKKKKSKQYIIFLWLLFVHFYYIFDMVTCFSPIPAFSPHRIKSIIIICIHRAADMRERNEPLLLYLSCIRTIIIHIQYNVYAHS